MIYFDHNATTPIASEVLEAMMPYLTSEWGNPSSTYKFGAKLKGVVEVAREQVAGLIGARSGEVIFTSCATESNNAAIHAALKATDKRHVITSMVEHSSVLNYCMALEKDGFRVTYLPVDREGLLKVADLEDAITDETAVVSLMWANNETAVLFPVKEIAEICRAHGVLFHCDAVQAALDNAELGMMNDEWAALLTSEFCLLTSSFPRCAGGRHSELDSEDGVERSQGATVGEHDQHHFPWYRIRSVAHPARSRRHVRVVGFGVPRGFRRTVACRQSDEARFNGLPADDSVFVGFDEHNTGDQGRAGSLGSNHGQAARLSAAA
jgi:hypothetical protein